MLALGLLQAGDHVVCSRSMFSATIKLIGSDLAKFGVQATFVPQTDLDAWRAAVTPRTRLLLAETPTNPLTEVCDIAALADIAHAAGAWLAVDNCFATPALQRAAEIRRRRRHPLRHQVPRRAGAGDGRRAVRPAGRRRSSCRCCAAPA